MNCKVCGVVNEQYDEYSVESHENTPKHTCNQILLEYKHKKKNFSKNRDGINIFGEAKILLKTDTNRDIELTKHHKIRVAVKPNESVKFLFKIENETKKHDMHLIGIQLGHPQPQFIMNDHKYVFGQGPHLLPKKSTLPDEVSVRFQGVDIGQYEMPIMFTFESKTANNNNKELIFIREMVVTVEDNPIDYKKSKSPYANKEWHQAKKFKMSISHTPYENKFKIPKLLKILLPRGLGENALDSINANPEVMAELRQLLITTRTLLENGITQKNYIDFFQLLLWWEEIISRINLRRYNMSRVKIEIDDRGYALEVPGLAEKRPSLLRGDRVYIKPIEGDIVFESIIKHVADDKIFLGDLDDSFRNYHSVEAEFDIHFLMSRVPVERMHEAVIRIITSEQLCRVFPKPVRRLVPVIRINKFYNKNIKNNAEQMSAVERIVSGSSGTAPYIVFGPPGTGKTMTIVEAIIQLVVRNPRNRVMVCTDSNMAADHIALMLLQYNNVLNINNLLFRASSRSREWSVLPEALAAVSNGTSYENFFSASNVHMAAYKIVVTTLSHAAKYGSHRSQRMYKLQMSHLFIDEACQASEPAALIPITGLLAPAGQLVLAGDPKQLGPICMSRDASKWGLGKSLLERLYETYTNLYTDPNYITMLVQNFRSDPDILRIPNELFYGDNLQACAKPDPLSRQSILGLPGGDRAIVFHAVNSREQRMGNAPSYYNERELDMLKRYIKCLINDHKVSPEDIGVIAPYIRQVYKVVTWLKLNNYDAIQVGTVEAFQGKEKRVILVSTVRANCRLLEYDAKYDLGFLVDDKRFNVALTRAKAKIIIIGNPTCLTRDVKWTRYMDECTKLNCYFGRETQQLDRSSRLLIDIAKTRFDKCGLRRAMKEIMIANKKDGFKVVMT